MVLLWIAAFGLLVPNGLFIAWLLTDFNGLGPIIHDRLALAFILDALLVLIVLSVRYSRAPIGPYRWPWFVALSLLGGLGFSVPFYWWLNGRIADFHSPSS